MADNHTPLKHLMGCSFPGTDIMLTDIPMVVVLASVAVITTAINDGTFGGPPRPATALTARH